MDIIFFFIFGGVQFDLLIVFFLDINNKGIVIYGIYKEVLLVKIDMFSFEFFFFCLESKSFIFVVGSDEGQYYVIFYYYSLGQGCFFVSWYFWGEMEGMDQVDFILFDILEELYEIIFELVEIVLFIVIDKNSFYCMQYCDDYDFSVCLVLLENFKWCMWYGMVVCCKLKELEK